MRYNRIHPFARLLCELGPVNMIFEQFACGGIHYKDLRTSPNHYAKWYKLYIYHRWKKRGW